MILGAVANLGMNAQQPQAGGQGSLMMFLPLILLFVIFYFLLIAPQRKKQKQLMQKIEALRAGDRIITTAGILGTVMGVQKDLIELKISSNTNIKITKSAVAIIRGPNDRLEGE